MTRTPTTITTSGGLLLGRDSAERKALLSLLLARAQRWAETHHRAPKAGGKKMGLWEEE